MLSIQYISFYGIQEYVRIICGHFSSHRCTSDLKKMVHVKFEIVVRKHELYNIDDIVLYS